MRDLVMYFKTAQPTKVQELNAQNSWQLTTQSQQVHFVSTAWASQEEASKHQAQLSALLQDHNYYLTKVQSKTKVELLHHQKPLGIDLSISVKAYLKRKDQLKSAANQNHPSLPPSRLVDLVQPKSWADQPRTSSKGSEATENLKNYKMSQ